MVSALKEYYRQGQQQAVLEYAALVIGKMIADWKERGVSHDNALQITLKFFASGEYGEYITDIFEDLWYDTQSHKSFIACEHSASAGLPQI